MDEEDKPDVPVIQVKRVDDRPWHETVPPPREPELPREAVEQFEDRCYFCFWRSWDVFESGAPMWSTCKYPGHQHLHHYDGWSDEYKYVECSRVANKYAGEKCPKFFPVLLRLPFRLAWRGLRYGLYRYYDRKHRKEQEAQR